ncbi:sialyltransferase [Chloropicon primus]|uniref:Sialyltransferase n=2 Tax=Chloropicon primus TaxID=1764295 RepID=A0A5B8MWI6_9CHLO|nr:sialyltransferase [Chloropicon primus]UPR04016.1 sialyltransferase [Chloropicon primus]|eukprot:QDZ24807.1 sialyltransferase [Chloropicon primus]
MNVVVFSVLGLIVFFAIVNSHRALETHSHRGGLHLHSVVRESLSIKVDEYKRQKEDSARGSTTGDEMEVRGEPPRLEGRGDHGGGGAAGAQADKEAGRSDRKRKQAEARHQSPRLSSGIAELQANLFGKEKRSPPRPGAGSGTNGQQGRRRRNAPAVMGSNETKADQCPCGEGGVCIGGNTCSCLATRFGAGCSRVRPLTHLRVVSNKKFHEFSGHVFMTKESLGVGEQIKVFLHDKAAKREQAEQDAAYDGTLLGTVDEELYDLLPDANPVTEHVYYNTCAIVGSSGIHHNFEHGEEIDRHEMVLRFNSAPTVNFERLVGQKTTFRITNSQNLAFRESQNETVLIHMRNPASLLALKRLRIGDPELKVLAFHPDFVEHVSSVFADQGILATSGLYGMLASLQMCRRVTVYGYQVARAQGVRHYHYYNTCDRPANQRRDQIEWFAVKAMALSGLVHLKKEECVLECQVNVAECKSCKARHKFKEVSDYGAAQRESCPKCSEEAGGCKPKLHWAFKNNWKAYAPAFKPPAPERKGRTGGRPPKLITRYQYDGSGPQSAGSTLPDRQAAPRPPPPPPPPPPVHLVRQIPLNLDLIRPPPARGAASPARAPDRIENRPP